MICWGNITTELCHNSNRTFLRLKIFRVHWSHFADSKYLEAFQKISLLLTQKNKREGFLERKRSIFLNRIEDKAIACSYLFRFQSTFLKMICWISFVDDWSSGKVIEDFVVLKKSIWLSIKVFLDFSSEILRPRSFRASVCSRQYCITFNSAFEVHWLCVFLFPRCVCERDTEKKDYKAQHGVK